MGSLIFLDLSSNDIGGTIPTEFGEFFNIEKLWLREMGLTGTIPTELGNLQKLKTLSLSKFVCIYLSLGLLFCCLCFEHSNESRQS